MNNFKKALGGLVAIPQWFVWRMVWDGSKSKYDPKIPVSAAGFNMDAQVSTSWMTFDAAVAQRNAQRMRETQDGVVYTLGFMFTADCGYWFYDLDGCVVDGKLSEFAAGQYAHLHKCFFEYSSSGSGVHFIGANVDRVKADRTRPLAGFGADVEFYTQGRGIAFGLGDEAFGCADEPAPQEWMRWLVDSVLTNPAPVSSVGVAGVHDGNGPRADWDGPTDDNELIALGHKMKSVDAMFGQKASFTDLFNRNLDALRAAYPDDSIVGFDESRADMALASHLCFLTGAHTDRIERIMRMSALARSKWDDRDDYLVGRTIGEVVRKAGNVYNKGHGRVEVSNPLALVPVDTAEALVIRAGKVSSLAEYNTFTAEIAADADLPQDLRYMLAGTLMHAFGKGAHLPIASIRAALTPARGELVLAEDGGLFKDWVYVEATARYYDLVRGVGVSAQGFGVRFDGHEVIKESGLDATRYASHSRIPVVYDTMFHPGQTQVFNYRGLQMINTYRSPNLNIPDTLSAEQQHAIDTFEGHLAFILPDEGDRAILRDWMAFVAQNPGKRVGWAVVLKGTEGDGKTYLARVMGAITGSVNQVPGASFGSQFNGWAHGSLVVAVEEIRVSGDKKYESLDRMKPLISNSTIPIEEKGRDVRTVPNFSSYLLFTNHADALPITASDRRYCVLETPFNNEQQLLTALGGKPAQEAYFDNLFKIMDMYPEALAFHLLNHVVSKSFNPSNRAPDTTAKRRMLEASISSSQVAVEAAIDAHACAIVSSEIIDVTYLNNKCGATPFGPSATPLPRTSAMGNTLRDMGYVQIENRRVKIDGNYRYIWFNPSSHTSESAINAVREAALV